MPPWSLIVGVQLASSAVAAFGAWRAWRLEQLLPDPRLRKLRHFFGLFSLAVLVHALGAIPLWLGGLPGPPRPPDLRNPLLWHIPLHHALLLASLLVAVVAFGGRRRAVAVAAPALLLPPLLIPGFLVAEAALAAYVAARSGLNFLARRNPRALRITAGFALFFLGHLAFWLLRVPGAPRPIAGEILTLLGVALLVAALPRGD